MEEKRLAWLDSLRAMAVTLVILGHVHMVEGTELFNIIYRFHMPLFFMMSGITHELSGGVKAKVISEGA